MPESLARPLDPAPSLLGSQVMRCRTLVAGVVLSLVALAPARAQDTTAPVADIAKSVVLDPTTYAPGILYYTSTHLDWASSQPFFQHGVPEHNPDFTISGRPDDRPLSYAAGNRRILGATLVTIGISAGNNAAAGVIEQLLIRRDPRHRKVWHALGWIERIGFSSYLGYQGSALHFEQWRVNQQISAQRGYR